MSLKHKIYLSSNYGQTDQNGCSQLNAKGSNLSSLRCKRFLQLKRDRLRLVKPLNAHNSLGKVDLNKSREYQQKFKPKMALLEGEGVRIINKFNGENINIWKFKVEMRLASVDFWGIMNEQEGASSSNANSKVKKEYQRCTKKAMSIIMLNLA